MRLTFPNGEHEPLTFDQGELLIGSDPACAVALKADGLKAMHVVLAIDPRGLVLSVLGTGGPPTVVNGRVVAELALLRAGDTLTVASIEIALKSNDGNRETPPARDVTRETVSGSYPRVLLRGLSGDWSGRAAHLRDTLRFGSDPDCDVDLPPEHAAAHHCSIDLDLAGIFLRAAAAGNRVEVNGHEFESAILKPNDQILIGGQRFLIEAPGYRPVSITPLPSNPNSTGVMRRIELESPPPLNALDTPAVSNTAPSGDFISEMPDWLWFSLIGLIAICSGVLVWYLRS